MQTGGHLSRPGRIPLPPDSCDPTNLPGYSRQSRDFTLFTVDVNGSITAMDVRRFCNDCPPDVGVVRTDNRLLIFKGE